MCLAQGHNTVNLEGIEPRPLDLESDALFLGHSAPLRRIRKQANSKP